MGRAVGKCSGRRRAAVCSGSGGDVGLAGVEALLEPATDLLAGCEDLVLRTPRGELHDAHGVVPVAVAARVGGCLVERPEPLLASAERHGVTLTRTSRGAKPG